MSSPTKTPNHAPPLAIDTNRAYCLRLAHIVFPLIPKKRDSPEDPAEVIDPAPPASTFPNKAARAPSAFTSLPFTELQSLFGRPEDLPADKILTPEDLAAVLERFPDVQARLSVITQYTTSKWVLERELEAFGYWPEPPRGVPPTHPAYDPLRDDTPDAYAVARVRNASGLCLSGGGIRSATFNLGILQALARHKRIAKFDYLASVSGGGYIHQFLANWIHNAGNTAAVEALLDPIPNEPGPYPIGGNATVQPEPLRWLRRYSNYLAPRKGIFSLDTWTIGATWTRNTALNFVVLLSCLFFLLLLPHLGTIPFASLDRYPNLVSASRWILAVVFLFVVGWLGSWLSDLTPPGPRPASIKLACISLLGAAILISPTIYRSSIPGGHISSPSARKTFARAVKPVSSVHYKGSLQKQTPSLESVEVTVDTAQPDPPSRLRSGWSARPVSLFRDSWNSAPSISILLFAILSGSLFYSVLFVDHRRPRRDGTPRVDDCDNRPAPMPDTSPTRFDRLWEQIVGLRVAFTMVLGIVLAYALIEGVRLLFFVVCFAVPRGLIPSLGVVLLPTLLFGVPFLLMEIGLGIVGRRVDSGQREWMARLRAFSFLSGACWAALTFFSLLGPHIFGLLAHSAVASYAVWGGWLMTTIGGILSGRSKSTANTSPDEPAPTNNFVELFTLFAPSVFVIGLFILVATFVAWACHIPGGGGIAHREHRFLFLFFSSLGLGLLFGWRVDINDFSMHAFYRDRLARCYAGAVDPSRKPNLFTGFTRRDRCLRVHQLLPKGSATLDTNNQAVVGTYDGPFPIVCTAINLTMGEDLAYQERKAASFAFTPLFSGYSIGWTAARSLKNQYNGFVDTRSYVYSKSGSITFATACAISGAAASPSMGYHSNPAVAFLLTVFNVRLGWWLRNPRRRRIGNVTPYDLPNEDDRLVRFPKLRRGHLSSSPRFGLLKLINELLGQANDTTSYVYLTDGGHFDNMGLYELLRRRCRTIVVCDAETDPHLQFEGIGMAIRKARLDFGIEVTLDQTSPVAPRRNKPDATTSHATSATTDPNQPTDPATPSPEARQQPPSEPPHVVSAHISTADATHVTGTISQHDRASATEGLSSFAEYPANSVHCVHGTIRYPEDTTPDQYGHILYIKASLTGDEPPDILNYRRQHEAFPQDTTLNQFFTESQFESYRRLGEHIILTDRTAISWFHQYLKP